MSRVKLPVTRSAGQALLMGSDSSRGEPLNLLSGLGFQCTQVPDPYAAMTELSRRPREFDALVLSLHSLFQEEVQLVAAVKRKFPHIEIWLTQTDGRAATLAEAMRLGADGLLTEDGLHRTAVPRVQEAKSSVSPVSGAVRHTSLNLLRPATHNIAPSDAPVSMLEGYSDSDRYLEAPNGEPVLTVEELHALLHEPPATP